jgi:deazaflavin-dependent oxidoreductase (nitroreductase family)
MNEVVSRELADDPTVDITTTGARSGRLRRIEIWMLDVGGRYYITGTPGRRDWLANLKVDPTLVVHLKRHALIDLPAVARVVEDEPTRRDVLAHLSAYWYRGQNSLDVLIDEAPMIEVIFPA